MAAVAVMRSRRTSAYYVKHKLGLYKVRDGHTFFTKLVVWIFVAVVSIDRVAGACSAGLGQDGGLRSGSASNLGTASSKDDQELTLTAMMYAIVAKVVAPARSSLRNDESAISCGYTLGVST